MALQILDAATLAAVSAADNQEDQAAALAAAWGGGNVTARVFAGTTLLATLTHAPWALSTSTTPRRLTLGARQARTFVAIGVPTKVVFRAGSTDIFELTAGVGSGDVSFAASITNPAMERIDGLVITAMASLPAVPTLNLPSNAPNRVVVESWASGSAVDVGTITLDTLIRADRFADPNLAADCAGWLEYGPASASGLPVLDGVQFSAKGFDIRAGGVYGQRSYRVMVMMRAVGVGVAGVPLVDGLFGDPRGVNHYPGPHKLRILSVAGAVMKTVEMRDGLPINDASFLNIPMRWTVSSRSSDPGAFPSLTAMSNALPDNKPMRPLVAAGGAHVVCFGDEPASSAATRNRIPRAKNDLWPSANVKIRGIYNGEDFHLADKSAVSGNGNAHPDVMPKWALSKDQAMALSNVAPGDPEVSSPNGWNWYNAMHVGWGYEPGALGGITRRSGPGGVRMDRTGLPNEIYQMALMSATRLGDGASTEEMAKNFALNCANYPTHYPKSMTTLDAINLCSPDPQPTVPGRDVWPVQHYYGGAIEGDPGEIWIFDTYGNGHEPISQAVEQSMPGLGSAMTTAKGHVRNGWAPDTEHNNRVGAAYASLLFADPVFTRLNEHALLETSMAPIISRTTWAVFGPAEGPNPDPSTAGNHGIFWNSRSNVLPFIHYTLMWWVASAQGVYTRAQIEERMLRTFARWKADVIDITPAPSAATTPSAKVAALAGGLTARWSNWDSQYNYNPGSGWVVDYGLYSLYQMNFLVLAKTSGLLAILMADSAANATITRLLKLQELNARMFAAAPWASTNDGPSLLLRSQAQGAVESDLSTMPTTLEQVLAHNPPNRSDEYWFLKAGATPGSSAPALTTNYAGFSRMSMARMWWDMFAPAGAERTAALSAIDGHIRTFSDYRPIVRDPCFVRFNFAQVIPALGV